MRDPLPPQTPEVSDSPLQISRLLSGVDLRSLAPIQRVLLATDGTLTDTLEVVVLEPIRLVKIGQRVLPPGRSHNRLQLGPEERVLERRIILQGARSGARYVYAESAIAIDRLEATLTRDLFESDLPIGRLWSEHRLETYKELLEVWCGRRQPNLPAEFGASRLPLAGRTYRVFAAGRPVMVITEQFALPFGRLSEAPEWA
jgi:chorismate-pyruvate lyase